MTDVAIDSVRRLSLAALLLVPLAINACSSAQNRYWRVERLREIWGSRYVANCLDRMRSSVLERALRPGERRRFKGPGPSTCYIREYPFAQEIPVYRYTAGIEVYSLGHWEVEFPVAEEGRVHMLLDSADTASRGEDADEFDEHSHEAEWMLDWRIGTLSQLRHFALSDGLPGWSASLGDRPPPEHGDEQIAEDPADAAFDLAFDSLHRAALDERVALGALGMGLSPVAALLCIAVAELFLLASVRHAVKCISEGSTGGWLVLGPSDLLERTTAAFWSLGVVLSPCVTASALYSAAAGSVTLEGYDTDIVSRGLVLLAPVAILVGVSTSLDIWARIVNLRLMIASGRGENARQ